MADVMLGTLDMLVLKALSLGPQHGWGISNRIQQLSRDAFQVGQGSLYPALHRLEKKGWIAAEWRTTENNRQARYYALTRSGRRALSHEMSTWRDLASTVELVLAAEHADAES
jgi:PadR family transcriptional regulator, regulatory protein PadR